MHDREAVDVDEERVGVLVFVVAYDILNQIAQKQVNSYDANVRVGFRQRNNQICKPQTQNSIQLVEEMVLLRVESANLLDSVRWQWVDGPPFFSPDRVVGTTY